MAFFDAGNPPITSTTGLVSNPSTATLCAELDSTQLGTKDYVSGQSKKFMVRWIVGASTTALFQLEQANSTALSASTNVVNVYAATGLSAQFQYALELQKDDRLRIRVQSTFTGNVITTIQAEALT
jgi:hypothetical protein